jgi:hypothetical protein
MQHSIWQNRVQLRYPSNMARCTSCALFRVGRGLGRLICTSVVATSAAQRQPRQSMDRRRTILQQVAYQSQYPTPIFPTPTRVSIGTGTTFRRRPVRDSSSSWPLVRHDATEHRHDSTVSRCYLKPSTLAEWWSGAKTANDQSPGTGCSQPTAQ